MLMVRPLTLKQVNAFIAKHHRHHKPVVGHRFSVGAYIGDVLVGVACVGRPVARATDQWLVAEITRLATDGTHNACSILYGACARAAKAMGFSRIQTFILDTESGTTLKAAGWTKDKDTAGGAGWHSRDGRRSDQPTNPKQRWHVTFAGNT